MIPTEPAALLHGDLWAGNYIIGQKNQPVLYDPAIYYGHREMDLAMTQLFGGFSTDFYMTYQEVYPLVKDWEERVKLFQLYPNLVHLRSEEHTSELQSRPHLVCRLLLEK